MARLRDWRSWAGAVRRDTFAIYLACRDPRTPWYAKAIAGLVVAYALSPIDLIPDFIPVVGYLDDLVLVPLGLWLVQQMIPPALIEEHRGGGREDGVEATAQLARGGDCRPDVDCCRRHGVRAALRLSNLDATPRPV